MEEAKNLSEEALKAALLEKRMVRERQVIEALNKFLMENKAQLRVAPHITINGKPATIEVVLLD